MKSLPELKAALKGILADSEMEDFFNYLGELLPKGGKAYNELITIQALLAQLNREKVRKVITDEQYDVQYTQLVQSALFLIDQLTEADFKEPEPGQKSKHGSILYEIPESMLLGTETECIVRLAFLESILLENTERTENTKMESVRVSEIMEVELLDPGSTPAFQIRSIVSKRMFLDKDDFAEWIFLVTPLQLGQHDLWLKVTVIEELSGGMERRDLVMKERIHILTAAEPDQIRIRQIKRADYQLNRTGVTKKLPKIPFQEVRSQAELLDTTGKIRITPKRSVPKPPVAPSPEIKITKESKPVAVEQVPARKKISMVRIVGLSLTGMVLLSGILYLAIPAVRSEVDWQVADSKGTKRAYKTFEERHPNSAKALVARKKLEDLRFEEAMQDTSIQLLKNYLNIYMKEGRYVEEALQVIGAKEWEFIRQDTSIERIRLFWEQHQGDSLGLLARKRLEELGVSLERKEDSLKTAE